MPDYRSFGTGTGCGYNYPDVILFSSISKYVVGLDVIGAFHRDGAVQTFRDIRHREVSIVLAAFFKTLLLRYRYRKYYDYLGRASGTRVDNRLYNLRSYDGSRIPFADNSFDVVVSNAVLEHIQNVDEVPCEAARVTKSEGISYHLWHNYYSLSGGHLPEALCVKRAMGSLKGRVRNHWLEQGHSGTGAAGLPRILPDDCVVSH